MWASYHVDSSVIRRFGRTGRWDMGPETGWTPGPDERGERGSRHCFAALATFFVAIPVPALAAQPVLLSPQFTVMISVVTAGALPLAGGLWALSARPTSRQVPRVPAIGTSRSRAVVSCR